MRAVRQGTHPDHEGPENRHFTERRFRNAGVPGCPEQARDNDFGFGIGCL